MTNPYLIILACKVGIQLAYCVLSYILCAFVRLHIRSEQIVQLFKSVQLGGLASILVWMIVHDRKTYLASEPGTRLLEQIGIFISINNFLVHPFLWCASVYVDEMVIHVYEYALNIDERFPLRNVHETACSRWENQPEMRLFSYLAYLKWTHLSYEFIVNRLPMVNPAAEPAAVVSIDSSQTHNETMEDQSMDYALSGVYGLKEIALLHLESRSFAGFQDEGSLNTEMWNTVVRTETVPQANGRLVILCHPARPMSDDSGMLPIPRYAAVTVDIAARGVHGTLSFQNEYVTSEGIPVDSDGNPKTEDCDLLDVFVDAVRHVLLERVDTLAFVATSGKHVHQKLVAEYCRYLNASGIDNEALDKIIGKTMTGLVKDEALEAIMRLKMIFNEVRGQLPSGIAPDRSINDTPQEHGDVDVDDIPRKLKYKKKLFGGAINISQPRGTEWRDKVAETWTGEIEGKMVIVKLKKSTGKMYSNEVKPGHRIMNNSMTVRGTPLNGMPEVDPFQYLVGGSDRNLARMALFSVERQNIECSRQSSSYLLRESIGGERHAHVHIASITADILNGMDMYYDRRRNRLIVKFLYRFMEVGEAGTRVFKLTELPNIERHELFLGYGEIKKRGYKLC